jgi:flagellar biosynthesis protein FlhA
VNALRRALGPHADILLVLLVIGILTVLFAPVPSWLLDVLILMNVSFALVLLLLTFYMHRPVEFSTFPSLLLIATLFRLALNVAATRLILSDADAGHVIQAVGAYVVGGNYVIGLIVFLILVVVQYVVVTSGAQRVSEVAARFTLDSMPGQQMSIDADLNMGFIDQAEAQRRRKVLEKQAGFYGAMDGASKFVKGDAIAGIVILLINIVGGLVIGVMQTGMGSYLHAAHGGGWHRHADPGAGNRSRHRDHRHAFFIGHQPQW